MKQNNYNNYIHTDISPNVIIEMINNKCLNVLGHPVISSISNTINNKTTVKFVDGKVLNFCNYMDAFNHLNIAYNLKIQYTSKVNTPQLIEKTEKEISKVEYAINKLKKIIRSFKNVKNSVKINKMILSNYLESYEWKINKFTTIEIDEIIDKMERSTDISDTRYSYHIITYLTEHYME